MTWCSCIACSNAAWVLGGVRLISSASTTCAKIGPRTKRNDRLPVARSSSTSSVPVMSPGIRSGVNCTRLKERASASATVDTSSVLASPGHAHQQRMAAAEEGGEHAVDGVALSHDPFGHLGPEAGDGVGEAFELLDVVGRWRAVEVISVLRVRGEEKRRSQRDEMGAGGFVLQLFLAAQDVSQAVPRFSLAKCFTKSYFPPRGAA